MRFPTLPAVETPANAPAHQRPTARFTVFQFCAFGTETFLSYVNYTNHGASRCEAKSWNQVSSSLRLRSQALRS
jgi:hypothetical protein